MGRPGYCCWRQFKCHSPNGCKRASVGAGVLESVSAWEKWKCSAETTPHMHPHPHIHLHILPLLTVLCSFLSVSTPPFAIWCSLVNQNTYAGNTMSLCNLSPCPSTLGALPPPPFPLSFSVSPFLLSLFFLDALFYLFSLTFLFKPAHMPSFTQLVTSLPVNVQKQHLSP